MPTSVDQEAIRAAALTWLSAVTMDGELAVSRAQLAGDFSYQGRRVPLIDRGRGIRKPEGWDAALSIVTAAPRSGHEPPYDDAEGLDGLHRYKVRRDQRGTVENDSLRTAMRDGLPLMWFYGLVPGIFQAIFPVYLIDEEDHLDQFVLALTEDQRTVAPGSQVEENLRRYLVSETKRRLHQPVFAGRIMVAYDTHCAVCDLHHRRLLDAAHIIPDTEADGQPITSNGLALCKIHHAAYDAGVLGIRPDHVVEIHRRLLEEVDGPMLRHGLQEHHGKPLMRIPDRRADRPDQDRLARRYARFTAA